MNDIQHETLLIQCLDDLEAGGMLAEIIARHPDQAAEIRPILEMAQELGTLVAAPSPRAQAASQALFLTHARAIGQVEKSHRQGVAGNGRYLSWWRRLGVALAAVVMLLVITLTVVEESAAALPGDALYPVKRTRETLQLALTRDKGALTEHLRQIRVDEIRSLLTLQRQETVLCEGVLESMTDTIWQVYGLEVVITTQTKIQGTPRVGSLVLIRGLTQNGAYMATEVTVLTPGEDTAPPTSDAASPTSDAASPTATPSPSPSQPSPTPTTAVTSTPDIDDEDGDNDTEDENNDDTQVQETPEVDPGDDNSDPGSNDDSSNDDNSGSGSGDESEDGGEDGGDGGEDGGDGGEDGGDGGEDDGDNDIEPTEEAEIED